MKRTAAGESGIFLPPPSSLRLSHPPSTPVISQRGGMPYGCKELLSEMFSLRRVAGWEEWPRIHLCQYAVLWCATQKVGPFAHWVFAGFVLTNPSCGHRISSVSISKQELPQFPFCSPETKRIRREKVEEDWSTMGLGWDADKVDYEVFPSYLLCTRLSLVIKSVLLFFAPQKLGWFRYGTMN